MCLFYKTRRTVICFKIKSGSCLRKIFTSSVFEAKRFQDIPGPKSLPTIGTLYQYFPILGEYKNINCKYL